jgi:hypothetical protein
MTELCGHNIELVHYWLLFGLSQDPHLYKFGVFGKKNEINLQVSSYGANATYSMTQRDLLYLLPVLSSLSAENKIHEVPIWIRLIQLFLLVSLYFVPCINIRQKILIQDWKNCLIYFKTIFNSEIMFFSASHMHLLYDHCSARLKITHTLFLWWK